MIKIILRYWNTIKYLKLFQIYHRIIFKVFFPIINNNKDYKKRTIRKTIFFLNKKNKSNRKSFNFINIEKKCNKKIEWENIELPKLWNYNLHYFDFINSNTNQDNSDFVLFAIYDWILINKVKKKLPWDSYPTSLRIVNWIKWVLVNNINNSKIEESLLLQTRWLNKRIEYFLQGNHLIANAKTLIFSGIYFDTKESKLWLEKGIKILEREINKQILNDGGHFELSPMYQLIIIEDFLDIVNILSAYNLGTLRTVEKINSTISKMFEWINVMIHPDKDISFFNDSSFNIAHTYEDLIKYASKIGFNKIKKIDEKIKFLKNSGYIKLKYDNISIIIDVAKVGPDIQPGHAHADTLSFEMSLNNHRLIVNSGTSTYDICRERHFQRSTIAHNTVEINNENSSDVWKSFRVGNRAYVNDIKIIEKNKYPYISASHNGYKNLIHKREWVAEEHAININDYIYGNYRSAMIRFYLHPDVIIHNENTLRISNDTLIKFSTDNAYKIVDAYWYPEFGLKLNNKCIEINLSNNFNQMKFKVIK
mgnify:FL=1